tara:strand:- start:112 stop:720 length:609 start_codon:yes stop_codon:yes gene_type:complete
MEKNVIGNSNEDSRIDPICGMVGTIPAHGHYFCCPNCIEKYEKKYQLKSPSYREKIPAIVLVSILIIGGAFCIVQNQFMPYFMGSVLIGLSSLKLWDWDGFSKSFQKYDVIAKRNSAYAKAYPIMEMLIGIALILQIFVLNVAAALIVLISISTIGVVQSIVTKKEIECACMGSKIKVPMTSLTLIENGIMMIMAISLMISF